MIGVTLALAGFFYAVSGFSRSADLLPAVLATGIAVNLVFYVASVIPSTLFDTREIAAVLPFGAVLAGRLLARPLIRARLTPVLAGVLALYAVALGYGVSQPQASNTEQALVGWLEAHHLSTGLGTYTRGNVTTLDSGGRVQMLTVLWQPSGGVPRVSQSTASWYDPRTHYADFVLTNTARRQGVPHPAPRDPRAGRAARAHLPLPDLHHHGLAKEPTRRPRVAAVQQGCEHRSLLNIS